MQVMRMPFKILTIAGCWPPNSWSSLCKRIIYSGYTILLSFMLLSFVLPQFLDIVLNVDSPDEFTDTFYVMLAMVLGTGKMFSLLLNRKNIKMLTNALAETPFRPLEPDEIKIRHKFDNIIQTKTIHYTILVEVTCAVMNLVSIFTNLRNRNLTYREWTPYEYSNVAFYIIYFRQLVSLTITSILNVACDCVICGLLLHICCQFEILECRLRKSLHNRANLHECVRQHDNIYKFAYMINEKFRIIIAVQFALSTLVVCSNLYQMTKSTAFNANYLPLILYMTCMLTQIFIYCWYGNEVKLKSMQLLDNIFAINWLTLDESLKKSLLIIMRRSVVPIEFTSAYVFTMNLDSFVRILKTSYSAYNILKQMQE